MGCSFSVVMAPQRESARPSWPRPCRACGQVGARLPPHLLRHRKHRVVGGLEQVARALQALALLEFERRCVERGLEDPFDLPPRQPVPLRERIERQRARQVCFDVVGQQRREHLRGRAAVVRLHEGMGREPRRFHDECAAMRDDPFLGLARLGQRQHLLRQRGERRAARAHALRRRVHALGAQCHFPEFGIDVHRDMRLPQRLRARRMGGAGGEPEAVAGRRLQRVALRIDDVEAACERHEQHVAVVRMRARRIAFARVHHHGRFVSEPVDERRNPQAGLGVFRWHGRRMPPTRPSP